MRPQLTDVWKNSALVNPAAPAVPAGQSIAHTSATELPSDWPSGFVSYAQPRYAGLTSAVDIARRQKAADEARAVRAKRSSLQGLTLRTALEDIREVLVGLPRDLYAAPEGRTLADLLSKNDRLRGLGLLAAVLASIALVSF